MKKYLLSPDKKQYKVNLHCHTTYSDANLTPAEIKKIYAEKGYSAVAFTDHDIFAVHDELTDNNFIALHGYEVEINAPAPVWPLTHCCHMCFIAKDPENLQPVCLHRNMYHWGNATAHMNEVQFGDMEDYIREYTPECINDMARKGRENGFFVTYNHPTWSLEDAETYKKYDSMDALEVYNYSCIADGYNDVNLHAYDDLLRTGLRIGCTGSDDNHNRRPLDDAKSDSFGAFTYILADKLSYKDLTAALENKDYYASMGPQFKAIWFEDGVFRVESTPVKSVTISTNCRCITHFAAKEGEFVTFGEQRLDINAVTYMRVTLTDWNGNTATSRAFFTDEMISE